MPTPASSAQVVLQSPTSRLRQQRAVSSQLSCHRDSSVSKRSPLPPQNTPPAQSLSFTSEAATLVQLSPSPRTGTTAVASSLRPSP